MADLLALVKTELFQLESEKVLSEIAEREGDFEQVLVEFKAGFQSADELRESAAAFAALVLAVAEREIARNK